MKKLFKTSSIIIVLIGLIVGAYFLGFYSGKWDQWKVEALQHGLDAQEKIGYLKVLRDGHTDVVIQVLEFSLETDILIYGMAKENWKPFWDPFKVEANSETAIENVVDYRKKYPSLSSDEDQAKKVKKVLAKFGGQ